MTVGDRILSSQDGNLKAQAREEGKQGGSPGPGPFALASEAVSIWNSDYMDENGYTVI